MKNLVFLILAAGILFSCSKHDISPGDERESQFCSGEINLELQQFPQTWKLVKMTGDMANSETTGADMAWQEVVVLNADGTFIKTRHRDNNIVEASGTFVFERSLGGDPAYFGLTLSYAIDNELIGSCQSKLLQETYVLESKCKLTGTWAACDGPGLDYALQVKMVD